MEKDKIYSYFINSCEKYLRFLVDDFSYEKSEPEYNIPECSIRYKNKDVIIDVIYEYSDYPWIKIVNKGKQYSLDKLMKKHVPAFRIVRNNNSLNVDEKVEYILNTYADALKQVLEKKLL